MLNPYSVPHDCEKQELAARLQYLSAKQQKVLRSYIKHVHFGDMNLTQWLQAKNVQSVSTASWRKPAIKGGNYWGTEESPNVDFRAAVDAYVAAMNRFHTDQEEKAISQANRIIRLASVRSATYIADLIGNKEAQDKDRLNAAKTVLDRASVETAEKSNVAVNMPSSDTFADMRRQAAKKAKEIEEEALNEWES